LSLDERETERKLQFGKKRFAGKAQGEDRTKIIDRLEKEEIVLHLFVITRRAEHTIA